MPGWAGLALGLSKDLIKPQPHTAAKRPAQVCLHLLAVLIPPGSFFLLTAKCRDHHFPSWLTPLPGLCVAGRVASG
jgi:hypothetical protein